MAMVLILGKEVIKIGAYRLQSGRPDTEKVCYYDETASEWDWEVLVKSSFPWEVLKGICGNKEFF